MSRNKYILFALLLSLSAGAFAQNAERDYIRKGNRLFKDSVFVDAEVNYRKALEANPKSTISMYNLGNTLSQQQKFKDAMEQYVAATSIEKDKAKLGQIYHNMGVLFQSGKDYQKAVEAYKMSLRNNPKDDETRYNLALAQKLLKISRIKIRIRIRIKMINKSNKIKKIRISRMIKIKINNSNNLLNQRKMITKCLRRMRNSCSIL